MPATDVGSWRPLFWATVAGLGAAGVSLSDELLGFTDRVDESFWWRTGELVLAVGPVAALTWVLSSWGWRHRHLQQAEYDRQLRRQEEEAMLVLGRLASSLAHEVRNPLNNIRLLVDDLEQLHSKDEDVAYIVERLKHNSNRINHAVELVYRLARPGDIRARLESDQHADLLQVLDAVRLRLPAEERERLVIVARGRRRLDANGDGECLQTIFENLIVNSLRYARQAPVYVDLSVDQEAGKFTVAIYNEGSLAGDFTVPDLDQFDRRGPSQGLGLGIIIVNRLVEQMKMELLFQSDENVVSFRVSGTIHRGLFDSEQEKQEEEDEHAASVPRFDS